MFNGEHELLRLENSGAENKKTLKPGPTSDDKKEYAQVRDRLCYGRMGIWSDWEHSL